VAGRSFPIDYACRAGLRQPSFFRLTVSIESSPGGVTLSGSDWSLRVVGTCLAELRSGGVKSISCISGGSVFAAVPTQKDYLGCPLCRSARWLIHVIAHNTGQAAARQRARWALTRDRCRYSQGFPQKIKISVYHFAADQLHLSNSDRLIKYKALRRVAT